MTVQLIAFPFRFSPAGPVVTVEQDSDEQHAQELVVATLTRPGERDLVPEFGIADPVFDGFDTQALELHVEMFGPPVDIDSVKTQFVDDRTQNVIIEFSN